MYCSSIHATNQHGRPEAHVWRSNMYSRILHSFYQPYALKALIMYRRHRLPSSTTTRTFLLLFLLAIRVDQPAESTSLAAWALSSLSSQPPSLHLSQSLGPTKNRDGSDDDHDRQNLEQVPSAVVQEEDELHGHNRTQEGGVGQRSLAEGCGEVVEVGAEGEPLGTQAC